MTHKGLIIFCVVGGCLLLGTGACSTDGIENVSEDPELSNVPVVFEIEIDNSNTRGSLMEIMDFKEYGVYGITKTAFAKNIYFQKTENGWIKNKELNWPTVPANFYSVNSSFDKTTNGGVMKAVTMTASKQTFTYVMPENAEDQFDMMIASAFNKTQDDNNGKVVLAFKRVFAYLKFKIQNKLGDGYVVHVGGISVYNLKNQGTFTYNTTKESVGEWKEGTTYGNMHRVFDEPFLVPVDASDWLVSQDTVFMSIPQAKTTKWKTTKSNNIPITVANTSHHTYLELLCKIQDEGGNYVWGSADLYRSVYMPFNLTTATKSATARNISISMTGSGCFDENGVPLSFGSDFAIDVEDWDETPGDDPIEVEF